MLGNFLFCWEVGKGREGICFKDVGVRRERKGKVWLGVGRVWSEVGDRVEFF